MACDVASSSQQLLLNYIPEPPADEAAADFSDLPVLAEVRRLLPQRRGERKHDDHHNVCTPVSAVSGIHAVQHSVPEHGTS